MGLIILCVGAVFIVMFSALLILKLYNGKALRHFFEEQQRQQAEQHKALELWMTRLDERTHHASELVDTVLRLCHEQQRTREQERLQFEQHQIQSLKTMQDSLHSGMSQVRQQLTASLTQHADSLNSRLEALAQVTDQRLRAISTEVEQRLAQGFEKTTTTFADVVKRLALIDEAQKKITELTGSVVSLQEILADKKSRGAFGEVQLNALIRNVMPEQTFLFQHTLSNNNRADVLLLLPEPTGRVVIDAKFPLENYRLLHQEHADRKTAEQAFRKDIRTHIEHIAKKYIIPGETSDGAMMFIPAEAIFAEIHANFPELVEMAQKARVWIVSPTTMMAVLTTARAVLKDAATRRQVHIIQQHLSMLNKDFQRFQQRMDKLAKHIKQAHEDAEEVHTSSHKISQRFNRIEQVDLEVEPTPHLPQQEVMVESLGTN